MGGKGGQIKFTRSDLEQLKIEVLAVQRARF